MKKPKSTKPMSLNEAKAVFASMFGLDGIYSAGRMIRVIKALASQDQETMRHWAAELIASIQSANAESEAVYRREMEMRKRAQEAIAAARPARRKPKTRAAKAIDWQAAFDQLTGGAQ